MDSNFPAPLATMSLIWLTPSPERPTGHWANIPRHASHLSSQKPVFSCTHEEAPVIPGPSQHSSLTSWVPPLTLLENPVHIEPIGGTGLIVAAALHICTQGSGTGISDDPRGGSTDPVWRARRGGVGPVGIGPSSLFQSPFSYTPAPSWPPGDRVGGSWPL